MCNSSKYKCFEFYEIFEGQEYVGDLTLKEYVDPFTDESVMVMSRMRISCIFGTHIFSM